MGDLHLVQPALNLSTLDAGILIMMRQVSLMMFSLNMVDYPMSFLLLSSWIFFWWTSTGDHSKMFLLFEYCCGTPPSCLKVMGGWSQSLCGGARVYVVAYSILVSAQGPLVLGLGLKGLGPGLDKIQIQDLKCMHLALR